MNNANYKALKDFGNVKEGETVSCDTWTTEQIQERIADGTIELISAPAIPTAIDDSKFQAEISWKEGTTKEEQIACGPFIQSLLNQVEEIEGSVDGVPACVDALTIRRVQ